MNHQSNSLIINSRQNPQVKHLVKLRQHSHRDSSKQFLIEGLKELTQALDNNIHIDTIFFCNKFLNSTEAHSLLQKAQQDNIKLQEVSPPVFEKITYRENPDGLLALAHTWEKSLQSLQLSANPLLLIAEAIEKPGNLGSLIRSVEATGADALIVSESIIDIFNPNVIHASRGLLFSIPIITTTNQQILEFLTHNNTTPIATTPNTKTLYWDINLQSPLAILVGSEKDGLSDFWLNNPSVTKTKIPLHGSADSLNTATAGVLTLYEALRQRRKS